MMRKCHILPLTLLLGFALCLINGSFADFAEEIKDADDILEGDFEFPTAEEPEHIQGTPEVFIFGTVDIEKMRDLPVNSQDYSLGRKVGMFLIPHRNEPGRFNVCTGFLVGPDLFMTTYRCIHDDDGLLSLQGIGVYMDYYQDHDVDATLGGITASVSGILRMDESKDYALLRLDRPIGNTYGWLELDTTTQINTTQLVKIIHHSKARSKEISRNDSQIVEIPANFRAERPRLRYMIAYLADTEQGSPGAPVFLHSGTGVIAVHNSGWSARSGGSIVPAFNAGTLMSYIVPEIQQWLPATNTPPDFGDATIDNLVATEGVAIPAWLLPEATDADGDTLTYSIEGTLPAGLVFNSRTRTLTGTPSAAMAQTPYTYKVDDGNGGMDTISFFITVNAGAGVPPPPSTKLRFDPDRIADQTFTVDTSVSLTLPTAINGTPPYTYSLTPTLPAGLYFDPIGSGPGYIGGTPTAVLPATPFTYTATDTTGTSVSLTFTITTVERLNTDVNGDGRVDVSDLVWVAVSYGRRGNGLPADVNDDGIVNVQDFAAVAAGIDTPLGAIEQALLAAAAEAAALEAAAAAPVAFGDTPRSVLSVNTAYSNVAEALVDTRHLAATDARLGEAVALLQTLLSLLAEMRAIPETTALLPNYPNPFNPETWIPYHLSTPADVTLSIYSVEGRLVRTLNIGHQLTGVYQSRGRAAYWDGRNNIGEPVASGLYFYTLTAGDFTATRKLLIAK